MRFRLLAAFLLAAIALLGAPAQATIITVDFSGDVTDAGGAYGVGTLYSGSFSYDPSAAPTAFDGVVFAWYPPTNFSLMIGSNTYVSTTGLIQTHGGGTGGFTMEGSSLSGSGPLSGGIFKINFFGSSDPTLNADELPSSFPTDFVATDAGYTLASDAAGDLPFPSPHTSIGALTTFAQVPEPPSVVLFATGVICLAGAATIRRGNVLIHQAFSTF
jgi:hypothetical protein